MTIRGFGDKATENFFCTGRVGKGLGWASIRKIAKRKLDILHYATALKDLRSPPGNMLKELSGNLRGYHAIRINEQWRIVFHWSELGATDVRICDYH